VQNTFYLPSISAYRDFGRKSTVFFPAVEREPHDSWRPGGHFPKCSRRTRPLLQVARAMSESLSIKEAHVWIVSISTGTKNAQCVEVQKTGRGFAGFLSDRGGNWP